MADDTLVMMIDEVRGKTLRLLQGVSEEQSRWTPPGLHNSILWQAGHAYCLLEYLGMATFAQPVQMPDGWLDMFSWSSKPETVPPGNWPKLAEVVAALKDQHQRAHQAIAALSPAQLAAPVDDPKSHWHGKPKSAILFHGLHDEAVHSGEVGLLRKLQGIR
jgi:hypothetical protein